MEASWLGNCNLSICFINSSIEFNWSKVTWFNAEWIVLRIRKKTRENWYFAVGKSGCCCCCCLFDRLRIDWLCLENPNGRSFGENSALNFAWTCEIAKYQFLSGIYTPKLPQKHPLKCTLNTSLILDRLFVLLINTISLKYSLYRVIRAINGGSSPALSCNECLHIKPQQKNHIYLQFSNTKCNHIFSSCQSI